MDLTAAAQELLAFITPKGRVFKWKGMPFGVTNAPALFGELMNKILYILRCRPLVQELISWGAEMEAHIDDASSGTNTKEDHVLLLREFFIVCQENHLRIQLEKCEFMKEEMEYLGFDVGYGWWKPAASKMQPLQDMQIRDDPKNGLHDVRSFVGACNFYRHHIHNVTYSSAPLTDLIKKTTPWRWTSREEECFQELKKKIASSNCLGVPRPEGKLVLINDASDVGGGGTIYIWQELNPAKLTHCHYRTSGLNRDGSLKHDYPTSEWRLVPLGHWNWKWNQARSNYSTSDQELLAGMLVPTRLGLQRRVEAAHPGGVVEQWLTLRKPSTAEGHWYLHQLLFQPRAAPEHRRQNPYHTHPERRGAQNYPQPVPPALPPGQGPEALQRGPPLDTATTVQQRGSDDAGGAEPDCTNCGAVAWMAACRHLARDTTGLRQYRPTDRTALASAVAAVTMGPVAAWPAQLLPQVPCRDTRPRRPAATHVPTAPLTAEQLYVVAAALLADGGESFVHHHGPAQIAGCIQGPQRDAPDPWHATLRGRTRVWGAGDGTPPPGPKQGEALVLQTAGYQAIIHGHAGGYRSHVLAGG